MGAVRGGEAVMMETVFVMAAFAATVWLGWEPQFRLGE